MVWAGWADICRIFWTELTDCAAYSWSGLKPQWMAANCPHTTASASVVDAVDAAAPRAVGLLALVALLFSA